MADLLNLKTARSTGQPNCYLVLPRDWGPAHRESPRFDIGADELARALLAVLAAKPRVEILARSPEGLQIEAMERSRLFRFIDRISARAVPEAPNRSEIAVFSRSLTGYWDLGVNRRRVERLLADLAARIRGGH